MRICVVAEGCYPYTTGGVSSWLHGMIKSFPEHEFVLMTILSSRSGRGKFTYELPENVTEVHETYLQDVDWLGEGRRRRKKIVLKTKEYQALRSLVLNREIQWETLFDFFQKESVSVNDLLMGEDFYHIVCEASDLNYPQLAFTDYLWTMRSIFLPLLFAMQTKVPEADLYHCTSTGYAGVLGSMGKYLYGGALVISEHGIYTREREEELIKADWVKGIYKDVWAEQFYKMSSLAYDRADFVTSLYEEARQLQIELGCPEEKTLVTPNGIHVEQYTNLPGKKPEEENVVNIGAVMRVVPIKDVKTLLQAFYLAKQTDSRLKLWIMGSWAGEEDYAAECFELVKVLGIQDVVFTGQVDVKAYLGRMDFTILTSISEGQPLVILESFAAKKPVIATNVGDCKGLVYGQDDGIGPAGILTHMTNVEEIQQAILELASDPQLCRAMGENGRRRVVGMHDFSDMRQKYAKIYQDFSQVRGESGGKGDSYGENRHKTRTYSG